MANLAARVTPKSPFAPSLSACCYQPVSAAASTWRPVPAQAALNFGEILSWLRFKCEPEPEPANQSSAGRLIAGIIQPLPPFVHDGLQPYSVRQVVSKTILHG